MDHQTVSLFVPTPLGRLDAILADLPGSTTWGVPQGTRITRCAPNALGIHDHVLHGPDGDAEDVRMRLLPAEGGCIVTATLSGEGLGGLPVALRAVRTRAALIRLRDAVTRAEPVPEPAPVARRAMSPAELREALVAIVERTTGIKGVEAVSELALHCIDKGFEIPADDVAGALSALVRDGHVVEVEYTVPETPGRVKSFLLPAGSRARPAAA